MKGSSNEQIIVRVDDTLISCKPELQFQLFLWKLNSVYFDLLATYEY